MMEGKQHYPLHLHTPAKHMKEKGTIWQEDIAAITISQNIHTTQDAGKLQAAHKHCGNGTDSILLPDQIRDEGAQGGEQKAARRTVGRRPIQRDAPALPSLRFLCCGLLSAPTVARHTASTRRCSPEGSRTTAYPSGAAGAAAGAGQRMSILQGRLTCSQKAA